MMKRLFFKRILTTFFISLGILIIQSYAHEAQADNEIENFSNSSFYGTYSFVGEAYGGNSAGMTAAILMFDGEGNFSGTSIQNQRGSSFGKRSVAYDVPANGTYTMNQDGTGSILLDPGIGAMIVITKVKMIDGKKIAQELFFNLNELFPVNSALVSGTFKRLPDKGGVFTNESIDGTYAFTNIVDGGLTPSSSLGIADFDADTATASGNFIANLPGENFIKRQLVDVFSYGPYAVNENGFGWTESITTGTRSYFIITEAKINDGVKVATKFVHIAEELSPIGNLNVSVLTRLSN